MTHLFEVTEKHIQQLDGGQLPRLLRRLFILQAQKLGVREEAEVNLQVMAADGGEDGYLAWEDDPEPDGIRIRNRVTCFQAKAMDMGPAACAKEVVDKSGALKRRIKQALDLGGEYVMYCGAQTVGDEQRSARETAMLQAISAATDCPENVIPNQVRFVDAAKVADWCNEFPAAQEDALAMLDRFVRSGVFQTVESWRQTEESVLPFVADAAREQALKDLRAVMSKGRSAARVLGLPGLGKTRLVLEAIVDGEEPVATARAAGCVYVANGEDHGADVLKYVQGWIQSGATGTVVVDECPPTLHEKLETKVMSGKSKLALVTLDHDPGTRPDRCPTVVTLDRMTDEGMRQILAESDSPPPKDAVDPIVRFAGGYPQMLALMLDAGGPRYLWDLAKPEKVRRMLGGRAGVTERETTVLTALSLFDHIGIAGDVREQIEWLQQHLCPKEEIEEIDKTIRKFKKRKIVDERADYVRLTPPPLAAALAASWWDVCGDKQAELLLLADKPHGLQESVASRLRWLGGHEQAEAFAERILGDDSPLASSERLLSANGSRMLDLLAEINGGAVLGALTRALDGLGTKELAALEEPRRSLVRCLEKLCWTGETYADASWQLLRLAAAENESWGNNATGVLRQLHQLYLSGTTVPAIERIQTIDRAIASGRAELVAPALDALDSALTTQHFTRSHSGELPDGRLPHKDWQPTRPAEIIGYWRAAVERLTPLAEKPDDTGRRARKILAGHVRGLVAEGQFELVDTFIMQATGGGVEDSPDFLAALRDVLAFDQARLGQETAKQVQALVDRLEPHSLEARLRHISSDAGGREFVRKGDSWESGAEPRARALGLELGAMPEGLDRFWPQLLSGEQPVGWALGAAIAEASDDAGAVLARAYECYVGLPTETRNTAVLRGLIRGTGESDRAAVRALLDRFAAEHPDPATLVDLTLAATPREDQDLERLLQVFRAVGPELDLRGRSLGLVFDGATVSVVARTISGLIDLSRNAAAVAVDASAMYLHRRDLEEPVAAAVRDLVLAPGVFAECGIRPGHVDLHYKELVLRVLELGDASGDFVSGVTRSIVDGVEEARYSALDSASELLVRLLEADAGAAWQEIAKAIEEAESARMRFSLSSALHGGHFRFGGRPSYVPIEAVPAATLRDWVRERASRARVVAAIVQPFFRSAESAWSELARWLLDDYGSDEEVRSAIRRNAGTRSWSGSRVPVLERERQAFLELFEHSNEDVAAWAKKTVSGLDREIAQAKRDDEAEDFGVYR